MNTSCGNSLSEANVCKPCFWALGGSTVQNKYRNLDDAYGSLSKDPSFSVNLMFCFCREHEGGNP